MNFLAHLALSKDDPDLMIGNAVADFTRRKYYSDFSAGVQEGIALHHFIDDFTDSHPLIKEMCEQWRPRQGKYAGVVNDIIMDHFLAMDFETYSDYSLEDFAQRVYALLREQWDYLPERAQHTFTWMQKGNWLYNYQFENGIERTLSGMSRRAQHQNQMAEAIDLLRRRKSFFKEGFEEFYPLLQKAVDDWIHETRSG